MSPSVHAVILAGGEGTRFWPLSRRKNPKQFLRVLGNESLLQQTANRITSLISPENIYIVTQEVHSKQVLAQVPWLLRENVLGEPCGRNTAPAIAMAALHLQERGKDGVMIVLAADHMIGETDRFVEKLRVATEFAAQEDFLVTLGIRPTGLETGYGYIRLGAGIKEVRGHTVHAVERFVEKPDRSRAETYVADGNYLWNSGIFIWSLQTILRAYESFLPELLDSVRKNRTFPPTPEGNKQRGKHYGRLPAQSVDYGILEKSSRVAVLPCEFSWSDLGSWNALYTVLPKDQQNNAVLGKHQGVDTQGCLIRSGGRLITTLGLSDLIVVETEDALLICPRNRDQDIKKLLEKLRSAGEESVL